MMCVHNTHASWHYKVLCFHPIPFSCLTPFPASHSHESRSQSSPVVWKSGKEAPPMTSLWLFLPLLQQLCMACSLLLEFFSAPVLRFALCDSSSWSLRGHLCAACTALCCSIHTQACVHMRRPEATVMKGFSNLPPHLISSVPGSSLATCGEVWRMLVSLTH